MSMIIIEGASTAEGYGGGISNAWAHQVGRKLPSFQIYNRARAGMSLSGINRNWEKEGMAQQVAGLGILRIISVGQNEARINPDTERPLCNLEKFAAQLTDFSRATKAAHLAPVYVGPQFVDESKTLPIAETGWFVENDLIEEYAEVIRTQAQKDSAPYVDVAAECMRQDPLSLLDTDGRHPNVAGHGIIAGGVLRALGGMGIAPVIQHELI